jgi:hypothetical protein
VKLLDMLNDLDQAGSRALSDMCLQPVTNRKMTLIRRGGLAFPAVACLDLRGDAMDQVHLGCDSRLAGYLADRDAAQDGGPCAIEVLAGNILEQLAVGVRGGQVGLPGGAPTLFHARGVRTFQMTFECAAGRLFLLAEVPSRTEIEEALGSDYLRRMEEMHLPRRWANSDVIDEPADVDHCLEFLTRVEGDFYLEIPADQDMATIHTGLLIESCEWEGRQALKFCADLNDPEAGMPEPGFLVRASAGVGDRSLEFNLRYLGPETLTTGGGMELPCAVFGLPSEIEVKQRRKAFRVSVDSPVTVEMIDHDGNALDSPWSDTQPAAPASSGRLADLSFSGARIVADREDVRVNFAVGSRLFCRMHFAERDEDIRVLGVVRRSTAGVVDNNRLQEEIGIEFLVSHESDRDALEFIRQYVLLVQRTRLAKRLNHV